jgi:hypothetical protein
MKKNILKILSFFKPIIVWIFEIESFVSKKWVSSAHKRLFYATWGIPKNPEFFDHNIDLFHNWEKTRMSFWLERGVFSSLALKRNGVVLELACGDGFNAKNFYSGLANKIIACDFERKQYQLQREKINLQIWNLSSLI